VTTRILRNPLNISKNFSPPHASRCSVTSSVCLRPLGCAHPRAWTKPPRRARRTARTAQRGVISFEMPRLERSLEPANLFEDVRRKPGTSDTAGVTRTCPMDHQQRSSSPYQRVEPGTEHRLPGDQRLVRTYYRKPERTETRARRTAPSSSGPRPEAPFHHRPA